MLYMIMGNEMELMIIITSFSRISAFFDYSRENQWVEYELKIFKKLFRAVLLAN